MSQRLGELRHSLLPTTVPRELEAAVAPGDPS